LDEHACYPSKPTISGRIGTGTKLFEKESAESLATELNEQFLDKMEEEMGATRQTNRRIKTEPIRRRTQRASDLKNARSVQHPMKVP
jgi:hypothetical protein